MNVIVQSTRNDAAVLNEVDVAMVDRNRLFLIECKTQDWNVQGMGQKAINQLSLLRNNLGGTFAEAMLISLHPLPQSMIHRLKHEKIRWVCGRDLINLDI